MRSSFVFVLFVSSGFRRRLTSRRRNHEVTKRREERFVQCVLRSSSSSSYLRGSGGGSPRVDATTKSLNAARNALYNAFFVRLRPLRIFAVPAAAHLASTQPRSH